MKDEIKIVTDLGSKRRKVLVKQGDNVLHSNVIDPVSESARNRFGQDLDAAQTTGPADHVGESKFQLRQFVKKMRRFQRGEAEALINYPSR